MKGNKCGHGYARDRDRCPYCYPVRIYNWGVVLLMFLVVGVVCQALWRAGMKGTAIAFGSALTALVWGEGVLHIPSEELSWRAVKFCVPFLVGFLSLLAFLAPNDFSMTIKVIGVVVDLVFQGLVKLVSLL